MTFTNLYLVCVHQSGGSEHLREADKIDCCCSQHWFLHENEEPGVSLDDYLNDFEGHCAFALGGIQLVAPSFLSRVVFLAVVRLTALLMPKLKANPELSHARQGENVWDPLDHKRSGVFLICRAWTNFEKRPELHGPYSLRPLRPASLWYFQFEGGLGAVKARIGAVGILYETLSELQRQLWSVKDAFDLHGIGNVPGVLGERAKGEAIIPYKRCCEIGQPPLLGTQ